MDPIQALSSNVPLAQPVNSAAAQVETSFGELLSRMVTETNQRQQESDQAIQQLHAGGEQGLHEAMIAMEKADISLRYMVQARNKAIEAYQEVMRMQV